jgi:hypothetical protein
MPSGAEILMRESGRMARAFHKATRAAAMLDASDLRARRVHEMSPSEEAPGGFHRHLTQLQSITAILTGLITIGGATYSVVRYFNPAPATGRVVAVVQEVESGKAVPDATVKILGPHDALVANLKPDAAGKVRYSLKEGTYELRVIHAKYATAKQAIQVTAGRDVDLTVELSPSAPPVKKVERSVKKLLGR